MRLILNSARAASAPAGPAAVASRTRQPDPAPPNASDLRNPFHLFKAFNAFNLINPFTLAGFARLTALATFLLLGAGGLVTSHGVGLAVPDWPNTYGYNMFFFPISQWVGGVFYEHTHRLLAAGVGLLTTILALWLYGTSARRFLRWAGLVLAAAGAATWLGLPRHWADGVVLAAAGMAAVGTSFVWPRCEPSPRWLRRLGLAAFLGVVLQGVLGGLRVVLLQDQLGIVHATLAQLFFVLVCAIALFTSNWWQRGASPKPEFRRPKEGRNPNPEAYGAGGALRYSAFGSRPSFGLRNSAFGFLLATTLLIFCQLILGAAMRHQHAGLAIPDFPLAYGKLWPDLAPAAVARYNQHRLEVNAVNPITPFQIELQMVHRLLALVIAGAVAGCAWLARSRRVDEPLRAGVAGQTLPRPATFVAQIFNLLYRRFSICSARRVWGRPADSKSGVLPTLTLVWLGLILTQALLGAATVWSDKAADIATAHVLVGALSLALGAVSSMVSCFERRFVRAAEAAATSPRVSSHNHPTAPAPLAAAPFIQPVI